MFEFIPVKNRKYWWPASALMPEDMRELFKLKKATGKPITNLLREAVLFYCKNQMASEGREAK